MVRAALIRARKDRRRRGRQVGRRPREFLGDAEVALDWGNLAAGFALESERLAFAIFDVDVPDLRMLLEQGRQLRLQGTAIGSPLRAEFEKNRTLHLVDLLAGRFAPTVAGRYLRCHMLPLSW